MQHLSRLPTQLITHGAIAVPDLRVAAVPQQLPRSAPTGRLSTNVHDAVGARSPDAASASHRGLGSTITPGTTIGTTVVRLAIGGSIHAGSMWAIVLPSIKNTQFLHVILSARVRQVNLPIICSISKMWLSLHVEGPCGRVHNELCLQG